MQILNIDTAKPSPGPGANLCLALNRLVDAGKQPSLAFDASSRPAISYYLCGTRGSCGLQDPGDGLRYAWRDDNGEWSIYDVDVSRDRRTGFFSQLVFDVATNEPIMVYQDATRGMVMMARGQYIEAPPVGHANHYFLYPVTCSIRDDGIEGCDGGFTPFQGESFLSHVFFSQKLFKYGSTIELFENAFFLIMGEVKLPVRGVLFNAFPQPASFVTVLNVVKFKANVTTVYFFQPSDDLP